MSRGAISTTIGLENYWKQSGTTAFISSRTRRFRAASLAGTTDRLESTRSCNKAGVVFRSIAFRGITFRSIAFRSIRFDVFESRHLPPSSPDPPEATAPRSAGSSMVQLRCCIRHFEADGCSDGIGEPSIEPRTDLTSPAGFAFGLHAGEASRARRLSRT